MADVTVRTLKIKLDADGTLVVSGVESAKRKLDELGQKSRTTSQRMKDHWDVVRRNWVAVTAAVAGIAFAMKSIIDAGLESARVWGDVASSIERHNLAVDGGVERVKAWARQMMQSTGIADEAIGTAFQRMIDSHFRFDDAQRLTRAAMDLSVAKGMDLVSAADLIAKSIDSDTNALARYGIEIDKTLPRGREMEQLLLQIDERFGGAAEDRINNVAGQVALLGQQWGELKETLFELFTPSLLDSISGTTDALRSFLSVLEMLDNPFGRAQVDPKTLTSIKELQDALGDGSISVAQYNKAVSALEQPKELFDVETVRANFLAVQAELKGQMATIPQMAGDIAVAANNALVRDDRIIPDMAEDIDLSREQLQDWLAESYTMQAGYAKQVRILYNGMTEAEFQDWEERRQIVSSALGSFADMFQTFANIQGQHQGAAFALFKAFAIAQAVIDTHAAYMRALATLPPPFSYVAAAAAVAAGIARVAAIASTQPNTGTTAVASSIGPGTPGVAQPFSQNNGTSGPTIIQFHLVGARVVDRRAMDEFARDFAPSLARARRDGAKF